MEVWGVAGIGEVAAGTDLGAAIAVAEPALRDGDVVVVTSKIVSKAEGRVRAMAREDAIDAEAVRVVAQRGDTRIVETRHGFVLAAAGVDTSNVPAGQVALLPEDPDASAAAIRAGLRDRLGVEVAVVVTDTMGRPWRNGLVDVAIGAAGLQVLDDHRGRRDPHGHTLEMTVTAVADEIAAAAELVKGKLAGVPVAVVRGLQVSAPATDPGARPLVRAADDDMFRWGTAEAKRRAVLDRHTVQEFGAGTVDEEAALRAVAAAVTAPSPRHSTPWRFVVVRREATRLLDAMMHAWIADLRADGLTDEQVRQRIRRGEVLRAAPLLIVPCLVTSGSAAAPSDERRATAVREMFLVSMGAALENLLVVLAADGLASAWLPSTLFCKQVVRDTLDLPDDWDPMGAVAVGPAAGPPPARPPHDPLDFVLER